jgi:REP element-mobilizing transposase RayT
MWVDLFTKNKYKNDLLKSWRYCCGRKVLEINAWVIISNHVYMIMEVIKKSPKRYFKGYEKT